MIISLFLTLISYMLNVVFSWLPKVTTLPTIAGVNIDTAFTTFSGIMHGVIDALPPMEIVLQCLLWYYGIKISLLTWEFVRWLIKLIRG